MCNRKEKKKTKFVVMFFMEENEIEDELEGLKKKKKQKNKYKIQYEEIFSIIFDFQFGKGWNSIIYQLLYIFRIYLFIKLGQEDLEEEVRVFFKI